MRQNLVKKELFSFCACCSSCSTEQARRACLYQPTSVQVLPYSFITQWSQPDAEICQGTTDTWSKSPVWNNSITPMHKKILWKLWKTNLIYSSEGLKIISLCYTERHKKKKKQQNGIYLKENLLHVYFELMTGKEPADLLNKQTNFPIKQIEYKNINKYIYSFNRYTSLNYFGK